MLLLKASSIAQVVNTLEERGSMDYTIIVAAAAIVQHLLYSMAALAEYMYVRSSHSCL
jgi:F0F1-type ATP synthase alpha subunit